MEEKKRHAIMSHVLWKYSNQSAIMRRKRLRLDPLFLPFVPLLGDFKTQLLYPFDWDSISISEE